jgi:hypothetical protein
VRASRSTGWPAGLAIMTFTAAEKRDAILRELVYRHRVFARMVAGQKMTQRAMDSQIAIFEAIRDDYIAIEAKERLV